MHWRNVQYFHAPKAYQYSTRWFPDINLPMNELDDESPKLLNLSLAELSEFSLLNLKALQLKSHQTLQSLDVGSINERLSHIKSTAPLFFNILKDSVDWWIDAPSPYNAHPQMILMNKSSPTLPSDTLGYHFWRLPNAVLKLNRMWFLISRGRRK